MSGRNNSPVTVLCVDDEPGMADLISTYLERSNESITTIPVESGTAALTTLSEDDIDCIVSDYDMPGIDGLELLDEVRSTHPSLPFILFTGRGSEEIASEAITRGVTDYMQKGSGTDRYEVLAKRVMNVVERYQLSEQVTSTKDQAETLLEASPHSVLVTVDQECVYVNPAAIKMLSGCPASTQLNATEFIGTEIVEFLPEITNHRYHSEQSDNSVEEQLNGIPMLDGDRLQLVNDRGRGGPRLL